jgi:hypothetical protein
MAIILPAEGDFGIGQADQPGVGDGDAVCVSAEIGEHLSRSTALRQALRRRLGIDHPLDPAQFAQAAGEVAGCASLARSPKKPRLPALNAARSSSMNRRRKSRERTRTGRKNPGRQATQRVRSSEGPPPGTTQWTCGWWCRFRPQVWSTATRPISAPRCFGSAAMLRNVSAAVRNRMA